jgi:hypothetical protein
MLFALFSRAYSKTAPQLPTKPRPGGWKLVGDAFPVETVAHRGRPETSAPLNFSAKPKSSQREYRNVTIETPELQPGMAERAIDTATDVSRTITEMSAGLHTAVDRLSETIVTARRPGKPLATISAITREAPLASLFVAFLFGVAVARRR